MRQTFFIPVTCRTGKRFWTKPSDYWALTLFSPTQRNSVVTVASGIWRWAGACWIGSFTSRSSVRRISPGRSSCMASTNATRRKAFHFCDGYCKLRLVRINHTIGKTLLKNANIFVDVDLTLVDANGDLLTGASTALCKLKQKGCHLFLWSTVGAEYARAIAHRHGLTDLFEGYAAKPDIGIDDMPSTVLNPFLFNVQSEVSWDAMVERILAKHVD